MTAPYIDLRCGDVREVLREFPDNFFDACVTDGPYGLGFMGKKWDTFKPGVETERVVPNRAADSDNPNLKGRSRGPASSPSAVEYDRSITGQRAFQAWTEEWAREMFRVLKPGAHIVSFGAPRAHHRMFSGLEDAGFEMRDCLAWLFGQGFPKSLNLKDDWEGWGTALKPAFEPIALARKPLDGTLTNNVREWGTGALNIDGCRVEGERWPADLVLDEEAGAMLDAQTGELKSGGHPSRRGSPKFRNTYNTFEGQTDCGPARGSQVGFPSRFFYCPKVSRAEREFGCEHLPARTAGEMTGGRQEGSAGLKNPRAGAGRTSGSHNAHPTVKPIELMRWLVRLVTPPGGLIVDPFIGSGTTGIAATLEGCGIVGIDQEPEWLMVSDSRISAWLERERQRQAA